MKYLHAFLNSPPPEEPTKPTEPPGGAPAAGFVGSVGAPGEVSVKKEGSSPLRASPFNPSTLPINQADPPLENTDTPSGVPTKPTKPGSAPATPPWEELAAQRWGPGLDDDTPGIVVDRPDPERRLAALEAAAAEPDRYEVEERTAIRAESDPTAGLILRRTPWGTVVWSDPSEPAIEAFGESP